jgi:hypothetical protein
MRYPAYGSTAISERPERTAQGYRLYRCGNCGKQFNERSVGLLNRVQYPSDVTELVGLWRLRYKLSLRDLAVTFPRFGGHGLRPTRPLRAVPFALESCSRLPSASGGNCTSLR